MSNDLAELISSVATATVVPSPMPLGPLLPPIGLRPDGRMIGELLIEMNVCTPDGLAEALKAQHLEGERVGETLVRLRHCTEWDVCRALGQQSALPCVERAGVDQVDDELVERLPINFARGNSVLPYRHDPVEGTLAVFSGDPSRVLDLDDLAGLYDAELIITLMPPSALGELINSVYSRRTKDVDLEKKEQEYDEQDEDILHASAEDAPIIRFVNSLIFNASKEKASDIHIEPGDKEIMVRNRVDGVLHEVKRAPKAHLPSIIARVKIMAGLNIAEKRLPQDGRIRRKIAGKEIDMRVATVPTAHGERVTIRLLDKSAVMLNLDSIGIAPDHLRLIRDVIARPHGIFLVTGPTGSGKTTTLYSALSEINTPDLNILTVEDPVEYQLAGISQVQVQSKINLTFAAGLRSFLRHDPDVIMVGEIRDRETAQIAVEASLTGHLVLSTLHTNSAPETVTRLLDMGMDPFNFADALLAVLAQRLVRRICKHCVVATDASAEQTDELLADYMHGFNRVENAPTRDAVLADWVARFGQNGKLRHFHGPGCTHCDGTGFRGRAAVHELMCGSRDLRHLIQTGARAEQLQHAAMAEGMRTLRQDGIEKVLSGATAIAEVRAVSNE